MNHGAARTMGGKGTAVRLSSWFAILVGTGMLVQWAMFLLSGSVPEVRSEPIRLSFHLAGELITALLLIVSATGVLWARRWGPPLQLLSLGMLVYTLIVSPGYFAQRGEMGFFLMFGVILVLALGAIVAVVKESL
jgi:hypothetical protein